MRRKNTEKEFFFITRAMINLYNEKTRAKTHNKTAIIEKGMITLTHLFNILIAKVMVSLQYKCNSQYKNKKERLIKSNVNQRFDASSIIHKTEVVNVNVKGNNSLNFEDDAPKRRLKILLISITKCFNKQLIIRSKNNQDT